MRRTIHLAIGVEPVFSAEDPGGDHKRILGTLDTGQKKDYIKICDTFKAQIGREIRRRERGENKVGHVTDKNEVARLSFALEDDEARRRN